MELSKAHAVASKYGEYNMLFTLAKDIGTMRRECESGGVVTITLPRRFLAPVQRLLEEDLERITKEIGEL